MYFFSTTYCPILNHFRHFVPESLHFASFTTEVAPLPIFDSIVYLSIKALTNKEFDRNLSNVWLSTVKFISHIALFSLQVFKIHRHLHTSWIQILCSGDNYFPHKALQSDRSIWDQKITKFRNSMIPAFSDILWVLTLICNVTRSWIRLVRVCGTLQGISTRYLRSCIPGERHCHRFAICLYTIMDRWNCSVEEDSAQFAWGGHSEYGHSWNCIAQGTSSSQHCEVCCYGVGWSLDFMM